MIQLCDRILDNGLRCHNDAVKTAFFCIPCFRPGDNGKQICEITDLKLMRLVTFIHVCDKHIKFLTIEEIPIHPQKAIIIEDFVNATGYTPAFHMAYLELVDLEDQKYKLAMRTKQLVEGPSDHSRLH